MHIGSVHALFGDMEAWELELLCKFNSGEYKQPLWTITAQHRLNAWRPALVRGQHPGNDWWRAFYEERNGVYDPGGRYWGNVVEHRTWANTLWRDYCHVSTEDPSQVAFVDDRAKGARGVYVRLKPGKYLTRRIGSMASAFGTPRFSVQYIGQVATEHLAAHVPITVHFATTPDDIVKLYEHGPHSCMANHPEVRVYGAGDLAVAYLAHGDGKLGADDDGSTATARALCWPERKIYGRVYGDSVRLVKALGDLGYRQSYGDTGARGDWDGARLLKVWYNERARQVVMPANDHTGYAEEVGEYLVLRAEKTHGGHFDCCNAARLPRPPVCASCAKLYAWADYATAMTTAYVDGTERRLCNACYEKHYVPCGHCRRVGNRRTAAVPREMDPATPTVVEYRDGTVGALTVTERWCRDCVSGAAFRCRCSRLVHTSRLSKKVRTLDRARDSGGRFSTGLQWSSTRLCYHCAAAQTVECKGHLCVGETRREVTLNAAVYVNDLARWECRECVSTREPFLRVCGVHEIAYEASCPACHSEAMGRAMQGGLIPFAPFEPKAAP